MRDIFDDIFKGDPLDPMEAARRNVRPTLRNWNGIEVGQLRPTSALSG